MFSKRKYILFITICLIGIIVFLSTTKLQPIHKTKIAIANWGKHISLERTIQGIKDGFNKAGYIEGEHFQYEILDAQFNQSLISSIITQLKKNNPTLLIALATPVAQIARNEITDIPIIFTDITDPLNSGLIEEDLKPLNNITGVSDQQDLDAFLDFVLKLIPRAEKIGILFSSSESNDRSLVKMMESAAAHHTMQVLAMPIEDSRNIQNIMQKFKNSVDLIYLGTSASIQNSISEIAHESDLLKIPIFNSDEEKVYSHQVFAAYTVSYYKIGLQTAKLALEILKGTKPENTNIFFPKLEDHSGYISKKKAEELGILIPSDLKNTTLIE